MPVQVKLNYCELLHGSIGGVMRQVHSMKMHCKHKHGYTGDNDWQIHIEGFLGELALAKYLNRYVCYNGQIGAYDVGGIADARTTKHANGHLAVHKEDPDERPVFLLTGQYGKYIVQGWTYFKDAKKNKYWGELIKGSGRFCYRVPQSDLKSSLEFSRHNINEPIKY